MYEEYLMHYGVKGMKWGVRKKYESGQEDPKLADRKKKIKRGLAIAGGVAGTAALAAGGVYAYKNRKRLSGKIALKTNKHKISTANARRDLLLKDLYDLRDEKQIHLRSYNKVGERATQMQIDKVLAQIKQTNTLINDLEKKPMTTKKFQNGLNYIVGLGLGF